MVSSQSYPEVIAATIASIATLEAREKRTNTLFEKIFMGMHKGLVSIVYSKGTDSRAVVCCRIGEIEFPFTDALYTDMDKFYEDYSCIRIAAEIARFLKVPSDYLDETVRQECLREFGYYGKE